jgi:hypothetical protein
MSEERGFLGDIAADIGDSYQDVLMQDASIDYHGPDYSDPPDAGVTFEGESLDMADAEIIPPDNSVTVELSDSIDAIPQTVEGDYTPVEEPEALPAPEPEIDTAPDPDMGGDMDGPSF